MNRTDLQVGIIPFNGWANNLRIANRDVELVITLDVGPRILAYGRPGGLNVMRIYEDQAGTSGEAQWRSRGGHRLWLAPESPAFSYVPDNSPVHWERIDDETIRLTASPEASTGFQKVLEVSLSPIGTKVRVVHRLIRVAATPQRVAPWALTVMRPGGCAILPQPPLGEHPRDMLPNRLMVVWPYTDLGDPRLRLGKRFITLAQDPARGPIKIGLDQACGWSAYFVEGTLFLKEFNRQPDAVYPDNGCNLEVFSNARMLELESLGPLVTLAQGESVEHVEQWFLHDRLACDPGNSAELEAMMSRLGR